MSGQTGTMNGRRMPTPDLQRAPHAAPEPPAAPAVFRRRHLLDLDDFSAGEIRALLLAAAKMHDMLALPAAAHQPASMHQLPLRHPSSSPDILFRPPSPPQGRGVGGEDPGGEGPKPLRGHTLINLFYENSTRTRVSFELAAKKLGADVVNVTASGSSVAKGESLIDTVRTLQALGAGFVVMRHSQSGAPDLIARHIDATVVNAGDGWHAHPSQALLDLYTLEERLGTMADRRVAIVGDILHSRVARSNLWALTAVGAEVVLCGPPTLVPQHIATLAAARPTPDGLPRRVRLEHRIERALDGADAVMVLRLQRERQVAGLLPSLREYTAHYGLDERRLALAKPGAPVLHPGPMNEGVEIDPAVAHGPASLIERQVANGLAVRMAILATLAASRAEAIA